ncbi:MAG: serine hydrolase domain-containing protein [Acidobacteriaceae bacterium]
MAELWLSLSRRRLSACVLFASICGLASPGSSVAQTVRQIRQIGDFYHQRDGFSGVIVVARGGVLVSQTAYGYANQELRVPISADTRFAIGSVTKQFTAACILLLQEQGRLKVSDPLSLYLPSVPKTWKDVTLRDLLTHTSGIEDDVLNYGFPQFWHGAYTVPQLIDAVRNLPLKSLPGEKFDYNNLGYVLLGTVVEKVSGQNMAAFLHDHIFRPLGMKNSGLGWAPEIIQGRAYGYFPEANGLLDADVPDASVLGAAGAMYSTGADLAKWVDALEHGRVLKAASIDEMNTAHLDSYGYGVFIETQYGTRVIDHPGDIPGFHSQVAYYPKSDTEFAVLSNVSRFASKDGPTNSPGTYAVINELFELEANKNAIIPSSGREVVLPERSLRTHTGTYSSDDTTQKLEIALEGGRLVMKIGSTGGNYPLKAESDSRFYLTTRDSELEFDSGALILFDYSHETRMIWRRERAVP